MSMRFVGCVNGVSPAANFVNDLKAAYSLRLLCVSCDMCSYTSRRLDVHLQTIYERLQKRINRDINVDIFFTLGKRMYEHTAVVSPPFLVNTQL